MTIRAEQPSLANIFCGFTMAMALFVMTLWVFDVVKFETKPLDCSPSDTYIE